jgi:xanthine dehydrogenase accessory factor
MSFDLATLASTVAAKGRVVRVVIAAHKGSAPRESGVAMLVWQSGQHGTIGGGTLEFDAARRARELLASDSITEVNRAALGPTLGQCCGGAVTVAYEVFDADRLLTITPDGLFARPVEAATADTPFSVQKLLAQHRSGHKLTTPVLTHGWLLEQISEPTRILWVWGAGHVGRAIVSVLAPFPEFAIKWVDTCVERFPQSLPEGVTQLLADNPASLVSLAPHDAEHLILTYSHALDLSLCHHLLTQGFARAGLIGSASKWARFQSRLRALGHDSAAISRIDCPIGDPALGKHPQAIAVGVVARLLVSSTVTQQRQERAG